MEKDGLAQKWEWKKRGGEVDLNDAVREFGHTIVEVFANAVKGVANSEGWFLFPSGREARQQLIGDAIAAYGQPGEVVFFQYNNLQKTVKKNKKISVQDQRTSEKQCRC